MIDVSGEGELLSIFGDDVAGEAFAVKHHFAAQLVFGAEGAGFCEDMAGAGGIYLNLRERAVFSENRERLEKNLIVRAGGPIGEVVDHKIGAEEVGPIAAGSIALRGAGQIELRRLEEIMFELETSAERVLCIFPDEGAEEVWPHAGVQVLA